MRCVIHTGTSLYFNPSFAFHSKRDLTCRYNAVLYTFRFDQQHRRCGVQLQQDASEEGDLRGSRGRFQCHINPSRQSAALIQDPAGKQRERTRRNQASHHTQNRQDDVAYIQQLNIVLLLCISEGLFMGNLLGNFSMQLIAWKFNSRASLYILGSLDSPVCC